MAVAKVVNVRQVYGSTAWPVIQFSSAAQLCLTLCDPMDYSMPGFPVHHQLPDLAQTHVHQVSDAIQPSPSPPALSFSQSALITELPCVTVIYVHDFVNICTTVFK